MPVPASSSAASGARATKSTAKTWSPPAACFSASTASWVRYSSAMAAPKPASMRFICASDRCCDRSCGSSYRPDSPQSRGGLPRLHPGCAAGSGFTPGTANNREMFMIRLRAAFRGVVACLALAGLPALAGAQAATVEDAADRTLSPYFFVHGDGATEQLPLKATDVQVSIAGVIADVKVTQRYRNDGKTPIEAEYVFPGS